jgi:hypothetical protein
MPKKLELVSWFEWTNQSRPLKGESNFKTREFVGFHKGLVIGKSGIVIPATTVKTEKTFRFGFLRLSHKAQKPFKFRRTVSSAVRINVSLKSILLGNSKNLQGCCSYCWKGCKKNQFVFRNRSDLLGHNQAELFQ